MSLCAIGAAHVPAADFRFCIAVSIPVSTAMRSVFRRLRFLGPTRVIRYFPSDGCRDGPVVSIAALRVRRQLTRSEQTLQTLRLLAN